MSSASVREPFAPHWELVSGRKRCEACGAFVTRAWVWLVRPGLWRHCLCEACVEEVVEQ